MIYFMKDLGLPGKGEKLASMADTSEHPSEVNKKIMNFSFIKKLCDFPFPRACSLPCAPIPGGAQASGVSCSF